jgi:4-hydroxyproline epimerase
MPAQVVAFERISVVDSHTGGEPTRVVVDGGPDLGMGSLTERRDRFRLDFDHFRSAVVCEPRGSDVVVGALLVEPTDPACAAGVIFFNNVGYLGMCGHGTIGLVATLAYRGCLAPGTHRIETPVGIVTTTLHDDGRVSVRNVPAYRYRKMVNINGVSGDIAYGGNWFYIGESHGETLDLSRVAELTAVTEGLKRDLKAAGITGADGAEIDHIELVGPPSGPHADARNFVLCPGGAYDRSPCGTGTSAKLACLYADGKLRPGQVWRQESIIGSIFEGSVAVDGDRIIPTITGTAYITAETTLLLDPRDPFRDGIRIP